MSTLAPYASPVESKLAVNQPSSKSPFWKIATMVGLNILCVPLAVVLFYPILELTPATRGLLTFVLFGIYHGHLFLLAYWMTFGAVPKAGRRTMASLLAVAGALPIGIMTAHQNAMIQQQGGASFGSEELPVLLPLVAGPPLIALTIIWLLHSIFMIPQHLGRVVINFQELASESPNKSSHGRGWQFFCWAVYFAAPVGLYLLLWNVDQMRTRGAFGHILISTLFSVIALTPAALLFVTDRHFIWKIGATIGWVIVAMTGFLLIPPEWSSPETFMLHCATSVTVILNLLILRALGLRWLGAATASPA
jgi:hypothetical protein